VAENFDGISTYRSEVSIAQISDGTSNTIFVAEKFMRPDQYETGDSCVDNNSLFQGNDWDTNRWVVGGRVRGSNHLNPTSADELDRTKILQRMPLQDRLGDDSCQRRFGSSHPAGFYASLCDGSVQFIEYAIDEWVYYSFGSRDDGIVAQ
jgi:hypothetical protein